MSDYNQSAWYVQQLTGSPDTVMDWRCIHDKDKGRPAHNYRGTLAQTWPTLCEYNAQGYGIFAMVNASDGQGRDLSNVSHIRAHFIDLDNPLTAQASLERAIAAGACFVVQSSLGKFHVYWKMAAYVGNEFFTTIQRKLRQVYDGDKMVIDATRVLRVPGFFHHKNDPFMVVGWALAAVDRVRTFQEIDAELANVNVFDFSGTRSPLGEASMAAPSLGWLKFALSLVNPNDMDRAEWLSFSAAFKQAGWSHSTDNELFDIWSTWCDQYSGNDRAENRKLWDSIRDTEVGWVSIERRAPVKAYMLFGHKEAPQLPKPSGGEIVPPVTQTAPQTPEIAPVDNFGEILSEYECAQWFKNCYFVQRTGQIFTGGRFMNSTQFNGTFGGKQFIVTSTGKITDEPWKAALRSTCWTIPRVDHVRFLPDLPTYQIVKDALKRLGLNTYMPAVIDARPGDVTLWLNHIAMILPVESDRKVFLDYLAHCVKFPGYKIPWAPLLQSTEGIGKTVFAEVMAHALGDMYVYSPKADELVTSGNKFNAWMRGKLLILVNEIKVDERRELIEILKPMITDKRVEVQSKGVDQDMEDNAANWLFFSNYKDAVPVNRNGRRYAILYSALQTKTDLINAVGDIDQYFNNLFNWLHEGGLQAIAHWLLNYPIEKGALPVRAPETSSHAEALRLSRSPMEIMIADCIADGLTGFKGGYISTLSVLKQARAIGIRNPNSRTVQVCLEGMGYTHLGRAVRPYMQEDVNNRSEIYGELSTLPLQGYGRAQGYE